MKLISKYNRDLPSIIESQVKKCVWHTSGAKQEMPALVRLLSDDLDGVFSTLISHV